LKNPIRRSAVSVRANIAEGFHRNSNKDFMKFLDYSRSSIAETLSHCYVALDQASIAESDMETLKQQAGRSPLAQPQPSHFLSEQTQPIQPTPLIKRSCF